MTSDPKSVLDRLGEASLEVKSQLRDLHESSKDLRALLRECEDMKREMRRILDSIGEEFRVLTKDALDQAAPGINKGVEESIVKYTNALSTSTSNVLNEVSAKIEMQRNNLRREVDQVRDDLKRTMDISKDARDISKQCADEARSMASMLDRLALALEAKGEDKFIRVGHDEHGFVKIETILEGNLPDNAVDYITHMGDKPEGVIERKSKEEL